VFNNSIPTTVRSWSVSLDREYTPHQDDSFTLIDVSEPKYFEKFVDLERIDEIIDHHPGLEDYWQERIGDRAIIERIGAVPRFSRNGRNRAFSIKSVKRVQDF